MFDTVIFVGGDIDPMQTPENIAAAKNWAPGLRGSQACVRGRFCLRKPACWTA